MPRTLKPRRATETPRRAPKRAATPRRRAAESPAEPEAAAPPVERWAFFQQGIMSAEQKRQLILAHATARKAHVLPKGWLYIMGIVASCLVVVAGWWSTVGTWVRTEMLTASQPGIQADFQEQLGRLEATYPLERPDAARVKTALGLEAQAGHPTSTDPSP